LPLFTFPFASPHEKTFMPNGTLREQQTLVRELMRKAIVHLET
jgi:hypothetical protein